VQQILTVDLFFINKLPFLLGELVPFGLTLCIPTKNRTAPVIAANIRLFINTPRSRDFGASSSVFMVRVLSHFSHLREKLSGRCIMLDVAGPGQHVPVVERKIWTMKERVRAPEISVGDYEILSRVDKSRYE
jgi:hypothetical protein